MSIRIERNASGNCLTFHGQTNPTYFNACLSGEVIENEYVNIINDIASNENETRYEYYRVHYSEFQSADFNTFTSAQAVVDYLTEVGNVTAQNDAVIFGPEDTLDFQLDATSTSVIFDNGDHHGVNSIKAVALDNGLISIQAMLSDHEFYQLPHTGCTTHGVAIPGGLNDVVNALNEYFTVGAFEAVVISDPYSTMVADVDGLLASGALVGDFALDPAGTDIGASSATHNNKAGWLSVDTIDQAGEYFTFDIRVRGQIGFGLVHSDDSYNNGHYPSGTNTTYADPSTFCNGVNSSHYGWQFSHHFHPTPNGPWTNYGGNTSYVGGPGWTSTAKRFSNSAEATEWNDGNPVKMKVGLDANSFIEIAYYDVSESEWIMCARSAYPVVEGAEFKLGIKFPNSTVRLNTAPKIHLLEPAAPVMHFRYIESPDGYYSFPLFATEAEADYYELTEAGADNGSHTHVYVDDPTFATWYMPNTQHQMNYGLTPVEDGVTTFQGNPIVWTEITSLTNAQLAPSAFSGSDQVVNENQAVNIQVTPQDAGWTTTVSGLPDGLSFNGVDLITGTTGYVPANSDYMITVNRTNSYGTSSGSFVLTIQDNASIGDLTGFTETAGNFVQPNRIVLTHDALMQYETVLSQDQQITYSYTSIPPTIGILSTEGETDLAAFDPTTDTLGTVAGSGGNNFAETAKWSLRYVTFGGYIGANSTKHNLVGWQDNSTQPGAEGDNVNAEFKLSYEVDPVHGSNYHLVLYRNGVEVLRSNDHYSGDQTITLAAFDDQQQSDVYVPANWTISNIGAGSTTPPAGFVDPLLQGQMDSTSVIDSDAAVQLSDTLEVGMRYVFPRAWVEQNVLPHISELNTEVFIGVPSAGADWSDVGESDFDALFRIKGNGDASHVSNIKTASTSYNTVTVNSMDNGFYDYAIEWDGTDLHVIACNLNDINTQPGVSNGGAFGRVLTESSYSGSGALNLVIATDNGAKVNLTTSNLQKIRIPFGTHDVLVGEGSSGNGQFAVQPVASSFDDPYQHASNNLSFGGLTTLNAGETYRFVYDPSLEAGDYIEFRLASDGTTVYNPSGTAVTTFDGTSDGDPKAGEKFKGLTFAVPADAPPLQLWYYNSFSSTFDNGAARPISISGSSYVTPVSGVNIEGPVANFTGNVINSGSNGWISLNEQLGAGERLVLDSAFFEDLNAALPDYCIFWVGLKGDTWTDASTPTSAFKGLTALRFYNTSGGASEPGLRMLGYANNGTTSQLYTASLAAASAFLEITTSGDNIRVGYEAGSTHSADTTTYSNWDSTTKIQTGDQGYGITSLDVVIYWEAIANNTVGFDISDVDWTGLSEISVPSAAVTNDTNWTKALDFSGSSERAQMVSTSTVYNPMMMAGSSQTVAQNGGLTSGHPWATACVFQADGNNSNQHIWNCGEGAGSTDDNIALRLDASGGLHFEWGRDGARNSYLIATNLGSASWYGVTIAHKGMRFSGADATDANLSSVLAIDLWYNSGGNWIKNPNTPPGTRTWTATGGRMDRAVTGSLTIGGRGTNRSFHGKVASFVTTTLKNNDNLPSNDELKEMLTDPLGWMATYKEGNTFRRSYYTDETNWDTANLSTKSSGTQIWLMGDGANDSYSNMIRNQVAPTDQNYTKLNLLSMVSNDIQTVNIPGLS